MINAMGKVAKWCLIFATIVALMTIAFYGIDTLIQYLGWSPSVGVRRRWITNFWTALGNALWIMGLVWFINRMGKAKE